MQQRVFYLHEDQWAMIDLLPAENVTDLLQTAYEAESFGNEHFDGFGWSDMYVISKSTYPLARRALPYSELQSLLQPYFLPVDSVQSGYSSYRETLIHSFAFVEAEQGERADGAFYGEREDRENVEDGRVTGLHLLPYVKSSQEHRQRFGQFLHMLGTRYDLVLANWWNNRIFDLREMKQIMRFLEACAQEE